MGGREEEGHNRESPNQLGRSDSREESRGFRELGHWGEDNDGGKTIN